MADSADRPPQGFDRDARPSWVDGLVIVETEDGLEIADPLSGHSHELDQMSSLVFELCSGERTLRSIVEVVQQAYELAFPPTEEVSTCLERLARDGLVVA
jgi:hypothetical protein